MNVHTIYTIRSDIQLYSIHMQAITNTTFTISAVGNVLYHGNYDAKIKSGSLAIKYKGQLLGYPHTFVFSYYLSCLPIFLDRHPKIHLTEIET